VEGMEGSERTNLDGERSYEEVGTRTSEDTSLRDAIDICGEYCNSKLMYNYILMPFFTSSNNPC